MLLSNRDPSTAWQPTPRGVFDIRGGVSGEFNIREGDYTGRGELKNQLMYYAQLWNELLTVIDA